MPRHCSICSRKDRAAIDAALAEAQPFRTVADRFETSKTALLRHARAHLGARLAAAASERRTEAQESAGTILDRLEAAQRETRAILSEARAGKNPSLALAALARIEKQLELEARLIGELRTGGGGSGNGGGTTVNVAVISGGAGIERARATLAALPDKIREELVREEFGKLRRDLEAAPTEVIAEHLLRKLLADRAREQGRPVVVTVSPRGEVSWGATAMRGVGDGEPGPGAA